MKCFQCNQEIDDQSKFCPHCGAMIQAVEVETIFQEGIERKEYHAERIRNRGASKYITEIVLTPDRMILNRQDSFFYFYKRKPVETMILLEDLLKVERTTKNSIVGGISCVFCALFGLFAHWLWFVVGVLFFFDDRKTEIEVWHTNGCVKIPTEKGELPTLEQEIYAAKQARIKQ